MTPGIDFAAIDVFIAQQRLKSPSAVLAIKAVRITFNVSLAIAKQLVEAHPDWYPTVEANRPFQAEVARIFEEMGGTSQTQDSVPKP